MKRRTLDIIFAIGGLLVAALILVLGLVLQNQANFAEDYVHNQLAAQKISFTPAKFLQADESNPCLTKYAGARWNWMSAAGRPGRVRTNANASPTLDVSGPVLRNSHSSIGLGLSAP